MFILDLFKRLRCLLEKAVSYHFENWLNNMNKKDRKEITFSLSWVRQEKLLQDLFGGMCHVHTSKTVWVPRDCCSSTVDLEPQKPNCNLLSSCLTELAMVPSESTEGILVL